MNEADRPIIVCGLGQVGYRVSSLLRQIGVPFVIVTDASRPEWQRSFENSGVRIVIGDARDEQVLLDAGLMEARSLIACTSHDLTNIEIALDAKQHRPDIPVITRMLDQNLAGQVEHHLGIQQALAMSAVAAPAFAAAAFGDHVANEFEWEGKRFVFFRFDVEEGDHFCDWSLERFVREFGVATLVHTRDEQLTVDPPGDLTLRPGDGVRLLGSAEALRRIRPGLGRTLEPRAVDKPSRRPWRALSFLGFFWRLWRNASAEIRAVFLTINALILVSVFVFSRGMNLSLEDAFYFVITTVTTTGYGDISPKDASVWVKLYACLIMLLGSASIAVLYSIVTDYIVTSRLQQLVGRQKVPDSGHVVVAGIGDVGYRVIGELARIGAKVVAVDADGGNKYMETIRNKVPVIVGDARDHETLKRAGADRAIATIAATGDDAVNLSIGLASESLSGSGRSVLRLFDGNFAQKVQSFLKIDVAMSASRIAAPAFVSAGLYPGSVTAFVQRDYLFAVVEASTEPVGVPSWTLVIGANGRIERSDGEQTLRIVVHRLTV